MESLLKVKQTLLKDIKEIEKRESDLYLTKRDIQDSIESLDKAIKLDTEGWINWNLIDDHIVYETMNDQSTYVEVSLSMDNHAIIICFNMTIWTYLLPYGFVNHEGAIGRFTYDGTNESRMIKVFGDKWAKIKPEADRIMAVAKALSNIKVTL